METINIVAYPDQPDFEDKLALINALHPLAVMEWMRGTINRRGHIGSPTGETVTPIPVTLKRVMFSDKDRTVKLYTSVKVRPRYPHQSDVIIECDGYRYPANEIRFIEVQIQEYNWLTAK